METDLSIFVLLVGEIEIEEIEEGEIEE